MAYDSFVFLVALLCKINIPILVPCFNKKYFKRLHTSNVQSLKNVLMIQISFAKNSMLGRRNCDMANHMDNMWLAKKRIISFRVLWVVFGSTFFSQFFKMQFQPLM